MVPPVDLSQQVFQAPAGGERREKCEEELSCLETRVQGGAGGAAAGPSASYPSLLRSAELPVPAAGVGVSRLEGGRVKVIAGQCKLFVDFPDLQSCYRARDLLLVWKALHGFGRSRVDGVRPGGQICIEIPAAQPARLWPGPACAK